MNKHIWINNPGVSINLKKSIHNGRTSHFDDGRYLCTRCGYTSYTNEDSLNDRLSCDSCIAEDVLRE